MIKQKAHIEIKKNENLHSYTCETDASLYEVYDVLSTMRSYVYGRIKEIEDAQVKKSETEVEAS